MALRIMKQVARYARRPQLKGQVSARYYSLYEPDYLETGKSKIPLLDTLNIEIRAYDFPVLEKYQKYVHNLAENIGIEVESSWALPCQETAIQRFKPQSTIIEAEYTLKTYKRVIQIVEPTSTIYPILLRLIDATLPEGVTLNVYKHESEHEDIRYVPDKDLIELQSQLDEFQRPIIKKK